MKQRLVLYFLLCALLLTACAPAAAPSESR